MDTLLELFKPVELDSAKIGIQSYVKMILAQTLQKWCKSILDSVEVIKRRVPIDRDGVFAFWISANKILFDDFTMEAAFQRFFKGIRGTNFIWRRSFKSPTAIGAFEGKFGCSHNTPSTTIMRILS